MNELKILVTGAGGMLGHDLLSALSPLHEVRGATRSDADLCDSYAVRKLVTSVRPDVVVHSAAYTDVDGCEKDPERAMRNNAQASLHVAQACKEVGATMLFISTDYVFDGRKPAPYTEEDSTNPISVYGQSKLEGEQHVRATLESYLVIRTSWLYGSHGKNFVDTIRRIAAERDELRVVNDQRGSPTYTPHLAKAIARLAASKQRGIVNVTGSGCCTWFEFSRAIVDLCAPGRVRVFPISTKEAARPAPRPSNSVLDNTRYLQAGFEPLPSWPDALREYLGLAKPTTI